MIFSGMDTAQVVSLLNDYYSIEKTLKRRGYDIKGLEDTEQVIQTTDSFYENFKSFSFRQILKFIYDTDQGLTFEEILGKISNLTQQSLSSKLNMLREQRCIFEIESPIRFKKIENKNYGRTFEWFISEIIKREMCGISCSGVKILNLKCGGDFDVIARLEDLLVHFECKSGSVNNVNESDITKFLHRYKELAPSLSILVFDTNGFPDNLKDKFQNADWEGHGLKSRRPLKRRLKGRGVFYELYPRVYSITNEGSLIGNIKLSINHFFSFVKPYGLIQPGPNYLSKFYDEFET